MFFTGCVWPGSLLVAQLLLHLPNNIACGLSQAEGNLQDTFTGGIVSELCVEHLALIQPALHLSL